jgi:hypothetical protein
LVKEDQRHQRTYFSKLRNSNCRRLQRRFAKEKLLACFPFSRKYTHTVLVMSLSTVNFSRCCAAFFLTKTSPLIRNSIGPNSGQRSKSKLSSFVREKRTLDSAMLKRSDSQDYSIRMILTICFVSLLEPTPWMSASKARC